MGSYTVVACFANSRIALKHVISDDSLGSLVKMDKTYLLFELDRDQYVYIKDYGGIAFFNIEEKKRVEIIESLNSLVNISEGNITEKIIVSIGNQIHNERFEEIFVTKLTLDVVHIICLNLTQSVALFYYQSLTKDLLQSTVVHIASLEEHGKFKMKHQQLLKRISIQGSFPACP